MTPSRNISIVNVRARSLSLTARVMMLWFLALGASAPLVWAGAPSEYELKAVFLLNFARFVAWPTNVLPPNDGPLVIGILGEDPFGSLLDSTVAGELVDGRAIVVKRFKSGDDITKCQVLYISRSENPRIPALLNHLRGKPVLTVSDSDRFAYAGGMIGLVLDQGRVRVQINIDSARNGNLAISAKLLRLSLVINDRPQSMIRGASRLLCSRLGWAFDKSHPINSKGAPVTRISDKKNQNLLLGSYDF